MRPERGPSTGTSALPCGTAHFYAQGMCVAYPGKVLEIGVDMAVVETDGRRLRATWFLVPELSVGDWVVVSAGTVLQILDPDEANEIRSLLDGTAVVVAPTSR